MSRCAKIGIGGRASYGWIPGKPGRSHRPPYCLNNRIIGRGLLIPTTSPKTTDRGIYEPWIDLCQTLVSKTPFLHGARQEIFYQNIDMFDQFSEYIFPLILLQVQGDTLLIDIEQDIGIANAFMVSTQYPHRVARWCLQFNHFSPQETKE